MPLSFYTVDVAYGNGLKAIEPRVPHISNGKERRPFVGVVLMIGLIPYYAPLTSPKPKHQAMKNQIDFLKINNGKWGAINFNNMIPVPQQYLSKVSIAITPTDTFDEQRYKRLLGNQLSWCNQQRARIEQKALKLYQTIAGNNAHVLLRQRCCDFAKCEQYYNQNK